MILDELSKLGLPVVFPLHPRTKAATERLGLTAALDRRRTGGMHSAQAAADRGQELDRAARIHRGRVRALLQAFLR
jgi:hypothetical protein